MSMQRWVNERFRVALGVFVGVAALAACAGPKTSPIVCEQPAVAPPTMISPTNGATGVADGNFSLVLSYASPLTIELDATSGTTVSTVTTTVTLSSPVPLPSASPAQSGVSLAVPALQAATTYTVVGFDDSGSGCGAAHGVSYSIGTFTTQ